ncbi:DUF1656 domain-containing protein [Stenotrophomonas sp. Iso1]|uniref:DUF1656 domain-containing protein n=1 Tax=Stenotrophomonas sp. Iso1 TaxID=2977283 RepID=UPI0022B7AE87|nr:DUF1656 domain-containing protein [Stenotrophomonas sp. Iso1]
MPIELAFGGALFPGLLLLFCVVCALLWALDAVAGRRGWYRYVWHPSLFRIAVFVGLFAGLGLLLF